MTHNSSSGKTLISVKDIVTTKELFTNAMSYSKNDPWNDHYNLDYDLPGWNYTYKERIRDFYNYKCKLFINIFVRYFWGISYRFAYWPEKCTYKLFDEIKEEKIYGIVGSRNYPITKERFAKSLQCFDNIHSEIPLPCLYKFKQIVSGGAKGIDTLAKEYALENKIEYKEFLPDWDKYGKAAGPIRNEEIVKASDIIIAYWDERSPGTNSTIQLCYKYGKPCIIYPLSVNRVSDKYLIM